MVQAIINLDDQHSLLAYQRQLDQAVVEAVINNHPQFAYVHATCASKEDGVTLVPIRLIKHSTVIHLNMTITDAKIRITSDLDQGTAVNMETVLIGSHYAWADCRDAVGGVSIPTILERRDIRQILTWLLKTAKIGATV